MKVKPCIDIVIDLLFLKTLFNIELVSNDKKETSYKFPILHKLPWIGKKLFTSNCYMNTFPNGLEFEILDIKLLKYILKLAKLNSDKEHVTPLIYKLIENKKIDKKKSFTS